MWYPVVLFFVPHCDLYRYFGTNIQFLRVSGQQIHSDRTFPPCRLQERTMNALSEICPALQMTFAVIPLRRGLFYPAVDSPLSRSPCFWKKGLAEGSKQAVGAARITKVKDYLHMVFLTRKREVLWQDSSLTWGLINRERLQKTITG